MRRLQQVGKEGVPGQTEERKGGEEMSGWGKKKKTRNKKIKE